MPAFRKYQCQNLVTLPSTHGHHGLWILQGAGVEWSRVRAQWEHLYCVQHTGALVDARYKFPSVFHISPTEFIVLHLIIKTILIESMFILILW